MKLAGPPPEHRQYIRSIHGICFVCLGLSSALLWQLTCGSAECRLTELRTEELLLSQAARALPQVKTRLENLTTQRNQLSEELSAEQRQLSRFNTPGQLLTLLSGLSVKYEIRVREFAPGSPVTGTITNSTDISLTLQGDLASILLLISEMQQQAANTHLQECTITTVSDSPDQETRLTLRLFRPHSLPETSRAATLVSADPRGKESL